MSRVRKIIRKANFLNFVFSCFSTTIPFTSPATKKTCWSHNWKPKFSRSSNVTRITLLFAISYTPFRPNTDIYMTRSSSLTTISKLATSQTLLHSRHSVKKSTIAVSTSTRSKDATPTSRPKSEQPVNKLRAENQKFTHLLETVRSNLMKLANWELT